MTEGHTKDEFLFMSLAVIVRSRFFSVSFCFAWSVLGLNCLKPALALLVNCQLIIYSLLLSHIRQLCKSDNSLRKLHYTQKMSFLLKKFDQCQIIINFFYITFGASESTFFYCSPKKCTCKTAKRKSTAVFSFIE